MSSLQGSLLRFRNFNDHVRFIILPSWFSSLLKRVPLTILIFFLIDIFFCLAYIGNILIGQPSYQLTILLDLNNESSLSSWYSSTQLFCVFILSSIFSYHKIRQNSKSIILIALPLLFLLLSIDESVQIHEWLGQKCDVLFLSHDRSGTVFQKTGIWMFALGIPFLAFFLLVAYSLKRHLAEKPGSLKKLVIGMIILLTGALGCDCLGNFINTDFYWYIDFVLEEGLEMIGVTVMLWAVYDLAIDFIKI